MDIKDRIEYSNEQMMLSLTAALDRMNTLRYDGQYRRLLGDRFVEKLSDWEEQIRRRKDDPFTVVVIGDFKRGKSTLINALLGEEVVTADVTTETVTLNRISYGAHANEAVLSGSRRVQLADSELKREELERVISGLGEPVASLELKRPCELLKKITVIDTPGTGDAMRDFSDMVKDSLIQADAVIYVYNVRYPLSLTEQLFLKSAVLPQKYTSLFLVGNYTDTVRSMEEYDKLRADLEQRVSNLLPGADVLMVSALDELCKVLGKPRPSEGQIAQVLEGQFSALRSALDDLIAQKADTVVLDRMQRLTSAMVLDLSAELDAVERGLHMSREEAAAALDGLRKEKDASVQRQTELLASLDAQIDSMKQEAKLWMHEFVERIANETFHLSGQDGDTIRQYYEFYCVDLIQEALTTCVEYHQDQLYDQLEEISSDLSGKLAEGLEGLPSYNFRFQLNNRIWTKGDTVGLAVSMIGGANLLTTVASLVADGVSGALREREAAQKTPDLVGQISGKLTGLTLSVNDTVETLYTALGESAKKLLVEYYAGELADRESLLEQAVSVSAREAEEKAAIQTAAGYARSVLADVVREGRIEAEDED